MEDLLQGDIDPFHCHVYNYTPQKDKSAYKCVTVYPDRRIPLSYQHAIVISKRGLYVLSDNEPGVLCVLLDIFYF